ncbi:hypothetical protein GCM10023093_03320 [Nemorincola caseinilytica]|uniref:ArnR1-like winged helix-turn-helix domain-containing protein n=1 Tax=Nemorincola caseinilytica TaxID=2054315 RepID=A0ABP8N505_9BACT
MNVFNIVLAIIRRRCVHVNVPYDGCLDDIRSEIDAMYHENIDFYLDFLQDLGLIKYNMQEKAISLTERGRYTETLFS